MKKQETKCAGHKIRTKTDENEPLNYTSAALYAPDSLKPHPDNPNYHPLAQIEALCEVIKENGWRAPVVVSNLSGYVIKGHGRLLAAQKLGCRVPVEFQDYPDAAAEARDLVADNKISELSRLNDEKVTELRRRFRDCANGWGLVKEGALGMLQKTMEGVKARKPKETKYPILILETQE